MPEQQPNTLDKAAQDVIKTFNDLGLSGSQRTELLKNLQHTDQVSFYFKMLTFLLGIKDITIQLLYLGAILGMAFGLSSFTPLNMFEAGVLVIIFRISNFLGEH